MLSNNSGKVDGRRRANRYGRRQLAGAVAALLATMALAAAQTKPDTTGLEPSPISIDAKPIAGFDRNDPTRTRFGRLEWRGGLVLTSAAASFGGWSGLALAGDGRRFVAVSDAGTWLSGSLDYDGARPVGLSDTLLGPLKARDGSRLVRRRDRDAEGVSLVDGTPTNGTVLIAFEQNDRIGRFAIVDGKLEPPTSYMTMPEEAKAMRIDGLESVTRLRSGPLKGAIVAFAERARPGTDENLGWLWSDGKPLKLALGGMAGFEVTDVAGLPNGDLLVLERRFRWAEGLRMRLRCVDAGAIEAGARLAAEVLLEADLGQEIDNMEGLGVHVDGDGTVIVTLLSDDNFNHFLQRTVLLQFALHGEKATDAASETPAAAKAAAPR